MGVRENRTKLEEILKRDWLPVALIEYEVNEVMRKGISLNRFDKKRFYFPIFLPA